VRLGRAYRVGRASPTAADWGGYARLAAAVSAAGAAAGTRRKRLEEARAALELRTLRDERARTAALNARDAAVDAERVERSGVEALELKYFREARAALAAAVLMVALLPLARRHAGRAPGLLPVAGIVRLPVQAQAMRAGATASRLPAALEPSQNPPEVGLFASIPMARLEAEPINNFPIVSAGTGSPILLAEGREVKLENGSGIVFQTGGGVFTLERRAVTPEDIFERRVI